MKFKKGEIVIIQSVDNPQFNGMETEVIESLHIDGEPAYICSVVVDKRAGWYESALRKRRPPQETTTWDQCVWQPVGYKEKNKEREEMKA